MTTLAYYEDYIETEIRKGSTEEEVLAQLGDPRLIAKSILATRDDQADNLTDTVHDSTHSKEQTFYHNGKAVHIPSWLYRVLVAVIIILFCVLAFTILSWLAPIIVIGILAYMIYKFIKNKFA